ncbi:uncharacterized protein LOC112348568 [Selaginella moellendorffii]|uniref:uncharacterized protein LOC112348568 n=1 Tax=Selaginella moellendorffii TaxID=88036 RepID=UPI000D1CDFC5|nr:uncharacterized protein LOC112348568 [Selaginella moellendorffii]|eukprot:XP_024537141.1 uncharacterized protein LOC112348568 [Selaginella moellendorffii]
MEEGRIRELENDGATLSARIILSSHGGNQSLKSKRTHKNHKKENQGNSKRRFVALKIMYIGSWLLLACSFFRWEGRSLWVMHKAFLWHQVRCMAAVLFMIDCGREIPIFVSRVSWRQIRSLILWIIDDLFEWTRPRENHSICAFQGLHFYCRPESKVTDT